MIVIINGSEHEVAESANLAELVAEVSKAPSGIAVALNEEVVPRHDWSSTVLRAGVRIEVLTAVQGG
ncbi:sulfur carrier protein ThiS [mine drainage metagenome]|uniref:Sulfur carrier protein ThiS n=1 Tax=mine drainage metagenome TaxID=410659 RepID=A0A1J5Q7H9_9ZZZZ